MLKIINFHSDFCTTHLKNQALFYIDRLGMTESKDGLFTKSYSKLLNRFKTSNITVVQYVVQNGHKLSWIRPSSSMQILWNNGATFKVGLFSFIQYNLYSNRPNCF